MHPGPDQSAGLASRPHTNATRERQSSGRKTCRRAIGVALWASLLVAGGQGSAGHQVGHYPSFYPHEIVIEALDPATAATRLGNETLHAYVGASPAFPGAAPAHVGSFESLGSYLVLSLGGRLASSDSRCAAARDVLAVLGREKIAGFVLHPYPVTPYHADYVHHVDRVEAARAAFGSTTADAASLKIGAVGPLAQAIVKARFGVAAGDSDIVLREVPAADLVTAAALRLNGWSGPPWEKDGWFLAYRLLAPALGDRARQTADEAFESLVRGNVLDLAEHANLERRLIASLVGECRRLVVGYAPRREFIDDRYPAGIENIAFDSIAGLNSPVFVRTAKLKDFPWNGVLQLGVRRRADSAWNPVAGFTDELGRLVWSAVGDPALIHVPFNASWMPNRVQATVTTVKGRSGGITVPREAVLPQPGTGELRPVEARTYASTKVLYEVLASPYGDGSEMEVADILYQYAFGARWSAEAAGGAGVSDPQLAAKLAAVRERLAGVRVLRVERSSHEIAEGLTIVKQTPIVEVYLRNAAGDDNQVAALAPPWSTVPWHLLALMEEAVVRGHAAFSEEEARRRKIPWLDLVRDPALKAKLQGLIAQFERDGYRPKALQDHVTAGQAQARWRALRQFVEARGHLLVANGPYRLKQWTPDKVVLQAVREVTYPLGFGTFDRFTYPPRGTIESAKHDHGRVTVRAGAEMVLKAGRSYKPTKEPLLRSTMRGTAGLLVASRYLLIAPGGKVLKVDKMRWEEDGRFTIALPGRLPPGLYTIVVAVFLDGNSMLPSTEMLRIRIDGTGTPG